LSLLIIIFCTMEEDSNNTVPYGPHKPDNDLLDHYVNVAKLQAPSVSEQQRKEQEGQRKAHVDILNNQEYDAAMREIHKWDDRCQRSLESVQEEEKQLDMRKLEHRACQSALEKAYKKRSDVLRKLSGNTD
jgi:hypothetical protein